MQIFESLFPNFKGSASLMEKSYFEVIGIYI